LGLTSTFENLFPANSSVFLRNPCFSCKECFDHGITNEELGEEHRRLIPKIYKLLEITIAEKKSIAFDENGEVYFV
jgi:hypothetical protein